MMQKVYRVSCVLLLPVLAESTRGLREDGQLACGHSIGSGGPGFEPRQFDPRSWVPTFAYRAVLEQGGSLHVGPRVKLPGTSMAHLSQADSCG